MLIDEFKKQTTETILDFMAQLGQMENVFSVLTWYLCEDVNWQFFYATQNEIVLVYVDYTNDHGSKGLDAIESLTCRITECRKILDRVYGYYPMIHGVFLSTISSLNEEQDIDPLGNSQNLEHIVFLQNPTLNAEIIQDTPVNVDENLPGASYWKTFSEETFKPFIGFT